MMQELATIKDFMLKISHDIALTNKIIYYPEQKASNNLFKNVGKHNLWNAIDHAEDKGEEKF